MLGHTLEGWSSFHELLDDVREHGDAETIIFLQPEGFVESLHCIRQVVLQSLYKAYTGQCGRILWWQHQSLK